MRDAVLLADESSLCAFAGAGCAQQNQFHGNPRSVEIFQAAMDRAGISASKVHVAFLAARIARTFGMAVGGAAAKVTGGL
ncbi:hypothetical protein D3C78_1697230 [compost metagenome]